MDNADAADNTPDPDDTAEDITAAGRLDGYGHDFSDDVSMFSGNITAPFFASSSVAVFLDPSSAKSFLQDRVEELDRWQGISLEGVILTSVEHIESPALGENTAAGRLGVEAPDLEFKTTNHCVRYQRGSVIASVCVVGPQGQDRATAVASLAHRMDKRIDGALSEQIVVTPLPRPIPTTVDNNVERKALDQGFDLRALLDLENILPGLEVTE